MRDTFRRLAALLALASLTGFLTVFGASPPPAHASGQIAEAAEALADGPGVWDADDFGDMLSPETIVLLEEAYDRSEVPIRLALVRENFGDRWDDNRVAEEFAAAVGEPGVYLVHTYLPEGYGWYVADTSWAVIGDGVTDEALARLHHVDPGQAFLTAVPDLVNGGVSAELRALADGGGVYVDPAVSAAFPEVDAAEIEVALQGAGDVRFGVVAGVAASDSEEDLSPVSDTIERNLALDMLEGAPDDAMAVLMSWDRWGFEAVVASGAEAMPAADVESLLWGSDNPEQVVGAARVLGAVLGPDVMEQAGAALVEDALYVHPMVADGLTEAELGRAAEALADYQNDLRVAILPSQAVERVLGEEILLARNRDRVAEALAEGTGGDVAVYLVDPLGEDSLEVSETETLRGHAHFVGRDAGAREILTAFEEEADGFFGTDREPRLLGLPVWVAFVLLFVVGSVLSCCWPLIPIGLVELYKFTKTRAARGRARTRGNRRGRSTAGKTSSRRPASARSRITQQDREHAARKAAQDKEQAARDAAWVERMRPRTDEIITELGEVLAQAPTPEPERLDEFERLMNAYTELKDACRDASTRSELDRVRNRAQRTLQRARTHAEDPEE
ncbi:hypothetical protein AB0I72_11690 [Nocardiopsis sp. NPDC049922]|uniref:hypothetical protein n=1 Tax=Nocardiopsis sp. NPDC049922 TaxID=3155157 RepID=UPI00340A8975